jgi:large subunit ribosomal protein L33
MAKKRKAFVKLRCEECKSINYQAHKSHNATIEGVKLELKKFCKKCRKHTIHKEMKK